MQTNPIAEWANEAKVPLLDRRNLAIAGVPIFNASAPITDGQTQEAIERALSKIPFEIYYEINKKSYCESVISHQPFFFMFIYLISVCLSFACCMMLDTLYLFNSIDMRDKNQDEIEKTCRQMFKNKSLKADRMHGSDKILWSARDSRVYSFDFDGVETTVNQYFKDKYGITLKFPHMPIIFAGNGWFPIEFVYQTFAKTRGAHSEDMKSKSLMYWDEHAGTE